ncbi:MULTISPECIES: MaoC/PaaZ C-terminal domain-containing protein [unclassified Rathayibacter]|jgi:acyl dehydratase|uniref:MaoC/PaaZ C-terminal domain-containing protein n=1 Tax=unclassified Rathayibacter TaxID=2609250 RepID=UPI000CE898DE|nr:MULTISPECIES: MaoC/PaaZ C-terminal domain-containing protein [unclassified Rathayibacter]PPF48166.1 acyl dehydratase [Rathayibacter sp. AY1A1]PPG86233.1 acyl dehydratase [Rathayibacter sp. AY1H2]PPG99294.1 acyl dehydratase [Rathayibacter sp. AY1G9]
MSTALPALAELSVGQVVAESRFPIDRGTLVRYAGASGDFNPIHYRDDVAAEVGLPGVLAHGMLTMGTAVQVVVDWVGDPGRVVDYQVRFTRPVVVHPRDGAAIDVVARIGAVNAEEGWVRVDLAVSVEGQSVLGKAQARVRLA